MLTYSYIVVVFLCGGLSMAQVRISSDMEDFILGNNMFAPNFYTEMRNVYDDGSNFVISPLSTEIAMAFVQSGCGKDTAWEIQSALYLPPNKVQISSGIKSLLANLNRKTFLQIVNKLYVQKDLQIRDRYKRVANKIYRSEVENINFNKNLMATRAINTWVERKTNNKIRNLVTSQDINSDGGAILVNVLYFKANWSVPFQPSQTLENIFYREKFDPVMVDTMHLQQQYFSYYECSFLNAKFIEMQFEDQESTIVIALPNEREGLGVLENNIHSVLETKNFTVKLVNVALPKFKIENKIDLKSLLYKFGVRKVFDRKEADLRGIAGAKGDLVVGKAKQKTYIDINEGGVEGSAASTASVWLARSYSPVALNEPPREFIADHPFIFYIKIKNTIIFVGRVTDPAYD